MKLGESVKKLRDDKHMTQETLAKEVGTTTSMIGHIETGMKFPPLPGKSLSMNPKQRIR